MSKKLVTASREALGFKCVCRFDGPVSEKITAQGLKHHVAAVNRKKTIRLCEKRDCFLTYYADDVHVCLKDLLRREAKAAAGVQGEEPVAD